MAHAVVLGDPSYFRIKGGNNLYTRNALGFRKKVDTGKAISQWKKFKETLERLGAQVFVMPPQIDYPGMVFPANAGFLYPKYERMSWKKKKFFLSNLAAHRTNEQVIYREYFENLGFSIETLPYLFEGEADFFPCGEFYFFTYGKIVPTGFAPALRIPPWRYRFSHRSDSRNAGRLQEVAGKDRVIEIFLNDVRYYHGDTVFFAFGKNREYLLAYLEAMDPPSREQLQSRLGSRLVPLSRRDAENFVANSFQLDTPNGPHLVLPSGVSDEVKKTIADLGFPYTLVDVSEFFKKGGGSIKCMLCDLGPSVMVK